MVTATRALQPRFVLRLGEARAIDRGAGPQVGLPRHLCLQQGVPQAVRLPQHHAACARASLPEGGCGQSSEWRRGSPPIRIEVIQFFAN